MPKLRSPEILQVAAPAARQVALGREHTTQRPCVSSFGIPLLVIVDGGPLAGPFQLLTQQIDIQTGAQPLTTRVAGGIEVVRTE